MGTTAQGSLVRAVRRIEEVLRQLSTGMHTMGDMELEQLFGKRGSASRWTSSLRRPSTFDIIWITMDMRWAISSSQGSTLQLQTQSLAR